jgi:hypothetical protein
MNMFSYLFLKLHPMIHFVWRVCTEHGTRVNIPRPLHVKDARFRPRPGDGHSDWCFSWFSWVSLGKFRNSTSNYAMANTPPIVFNLLFTEQPIMGYGLNGRGSIPGRGKRIFCSPVSRPALGPTEPPIQRILWALYPGVKEPGRKSDHPPPSSAEVKNVGAIPPLPMSSWRSA